MLDWNKFTEKHSKTLLLFCVIIFIVFSSFHLDDKFTADEIDFVQAGKAVAETGRPVYYQGELHPEFNGTWHPPLFVSLVGLTFYTAGVGEIQVRTLTMTFAALTILLVFLLSLELFKDRDNKFTIAILACYIYALNPITVQSGLLIDIDTGLLIFAMTLFLFLFIKQKDSMTPLKLIFMGFAFAILIWIKFGTPPVLLAGIFFFYLMKRQYKKALGYPLVIGAVGAFTFVGSWYMVANLKDLPFNMPFTHNSGTLSNMGFESREIRYVLYVLGGRLKLIVFWLTPFLIFFAQTVLRHRLKRFRKTKDLENIDLLLIIVMIIFIQYTLIISVAYFFPKYYIPMVPLLAILVAYCICQHRYFPREKLDQKESKNKKNVKSVDNKELSNGYRAFQIYVSLFIIFILIMFLLLGDPNLSRDDPLKSLIIIGIYFIPFALTLLTIKFLFKSQFQWTISWRKAFFTAVIIGLAASSIYINAMQIKADYSVRYYYGEKGMDEAIDFIKSNTNESSVIIAPKDVGYYSELRYYEAYGAWMVDEELLNNTIESRDIRIIAIRYEGAFGYNELPDDIIDFLEDRFDQIHNSDFHDFAVFKKKGFDSI